MNSGETPPTRRPRPTLHFTARRGWINDPHGVTFRDGRYHLFYQAVPDATRWQPWCSWGHATSRDLTTWQQQPTALTPGDGDYGCWSGSVCTTPTDLPAAMFYTSVTRHDLDRGAVRTARPLDDDWTTWQKDGVLVPAPDDPAVVIFRDPNVFWDTDHWRMIVGAGYADGSPGVLTYSSTDRTRWHYDGPLTEDAPPPAHRGPRRAAWECPQLIQIADRHVLLVSVLADGTTTYAAAAVGSYRDGRMRIDHWTRLTHGPGHYAPSSFLDEAGEPCLIFWIRDVGDARDGWSGALSIPYRVTLVGDRVKLTPHPNLHTARPDPRQASGFSWWPSEGKTGRLHVRSADDQPVVELIATDNQITVATSAGSVTAPGRAEEINVLIDGPVLEVYTGESLVGLPVPATTDLAPTTGDISSWWPSQE
jgi:beta-fructofuranosidase